MKKIEYYINEFYNLRKIYDFDIELIYGLNMKTCSYVEFSLIIIMFKHLFYLIVYHG
jgi:hypothetical protein